MLEPCKKSKVAPHSSIHWVSRDEGICGFNPTIEAAGYEPYWIELDHCLGKKDRILAAIRQFRFEVHATLAGWL